MATATAQFDDAPMSQWAAVLVIDPGCACRTTQTLLISQAFFDEPAMFDKTSALEPPSLDYEYYVNIAATHVCG